MYLFVDILPGLNPQWYIRIYKCDYTRLEHAARIGHFRSTTTTTFQLLVTVKCNLRVLLIGLN